MMEFIVPYYFDRICNPLDILLQVPKYLITCLFIIEIWLN